MRISQSIVHEVPCKTLARHRLAASSVLHDRPQTKQRILKQFIKFLHFLSIFRSVFWYTLPFCYGLALAGFLGQKRKYFWRYQGGPSGPPLTARWVSKPLTAPGVKTLPKYSDEHKKIIRNLNFDLKFRKLRKAWKGMRVFKFLIKNLSKVVRFLQM